MSGSTGDSHPGFAEALLFWQQPQFSIASPQTTRYKGRTTDCWGMLGCVVEIAATVVVI